MADVKWIKLSVDMFDNRKVKYLRHLPEGDSIILIWVMLLTMAGRCNSGGMIFLTENIPYTTKMLADELGFEQNTIELALTALEGMGMICTDGALLIANWEEYQNVEGMDKIREQTRKRVANYRAKQKQLVECNVTGNATVTPSNAIDIDIEIDKEESKRKRFTPPSVDDVSAYVSEKGYCVNPHAFVDYYESNGWMVGRNKMKDWKAAVRTWEKREKANTPAAAQTPPKAKRVPCPKCGKTLSKNTQTGKYFCDVCFDSYSKKEVESW